jgi:DNA polymerase elongation subunit (family B)
MLEHINVFNLMFIDIETVPQESSFEKLNENLRQLWSTKHSQLHTIDESPEDGYLKRAGVFSEFAKVICISVGVFYKEKETGTRKFRIKTFAGDDERELLQNFVELLSGKFSKDDRYHFCGHNIREFDIPFICRRLVIHQIDIPPILNLSGKRPWEVNDVDTLQLWKFGDYKHFTSLKLLAEVLNIPTPKDDIEGKDVCRVYWAEKGLERIAAYCRKDVVTVARLLLRFKNDKEGLDDTTVESL